ncbi:hypothetical protein ACH5RR_037089 [Cinchona calisaya]|uniref:Uncharacterized protein n=1 Tax=Cinchona calisaya TaxID=153742 RepID=A0ABD2Y6M8_9GENT
MSLHDQMQKDQVEHEERPSDAAPVMEVVVEQVVTQPPPQQLIDPTNFPTNLEIQILNSLEGESHPTNLVEKISPTDSVAIVLAQLNEPTNQATTPPIQNSNTLSKEDS